jgi:glucose/arabinose dehydrogenase
MGRRAGSAAAATTVALLASWLLIAAGGCARGPAYVPLESRVTIDRTIVETPAGLRAAVALRGLTAPTAFCFVREPGEYEGAMLIAESGAGGFRPRIYGFRHDLTYFDIYPRGRRVPTFGLLKGANDIYGPIGGMTVSQGRISVTHRDAAGFGCVSAFDFNGNKTTIVGGLPARGDYSVTDIAVHPTTGRLYFGVGAATNSGVVGLDNWAVGWVKRFPKVCDIPSATLKLLGYRFDTPNPMAGIFGGADIAVTAPFSPFGVSNQTRVPKAADGKPTSAIYSVNPNGGDLRVEAWGIRLPRGLAFNEYANLFITNNGMELRGTRPVKDDPDVLLKFQQTWYGFPDFSADFNPISDERYQPPRELIQPHGYPDNSFVIDHNGSGLSSPAPFKDQLLFGTFPALSGAAKMDFVPSDKSFKDLRGSAIVALSGDRAPFATGGRKLKAPVGYKVMSIDDRDHLPKDFVRNTSGLPMSMTTGRPESLERPIDVKFGPDGKLYILDFGRMEVRSGKEKIAGGTGKIFVVEPEAAPTTLGSEPEHRGEWKIR